MIDWFLISAIIAGLLFPLFAIYGSRNIRQLLEEGSTNKTLIFRWTSIELIALGGIVMAPFWITGVSLDTIGLSFISNPLYVAILFTITAIVFWLLWQMKINQETAETIKSQYDAISFLMPEQQGEYRLTVFVSYVAGIFEEIAYRGFLLWFLSGQMHIVPAIILANLPFAMAHLTSTGVKNSFMAFILALVFTAAFLLTGSLWLPILLHILVDLYSMTMYYRGYRVRALAG